MKVSGIVLALLWVAGAANAAEVACVDGRADGYDCRGVNLVAHLTADQIGGGPLSDIWGWTDPGSGREIAIVGQYNGVSFVDITDPEQPVYLGELAGHDAQTASAPGMLAPASAGGDRLTVQHAGESRWRDVKVYDHYALIVSEETTQGMQVFDLSTLPAANATGLPQEFTETAHYDQFGNAHNIAVNEATGHAFAMGSTSGAYPYKGGLHIIDLSDPLQPQRLGGYSGDGYTHDAQCVTYNGPDTGYTGREICFACNEDTLTIVDVTTPSAPVMISRSSYPGVVYTHQGWLSDDQRYFFMNDEGDEYTTFSRTRTLIWDLSQLDQPQLAAQYLAPSLAIDHNNYVSGHFLYQSNYTSGLRLLDISRPETPLEVGYFDTQPNTDAAVFAGTWSNYPFFPSGIVALSDIHDGLFLLRPTVVSATANVDLSVTLDGPDTAMVGDDMTYEPGVVNNGPDTAPDVELVLSLPFAGGVPAGVQDGDCDLLGVTVICRLGDLAAGDSRTVHIPTRFSLSGTYKAIAFAAAQAAEQDTGDNRVVQSVTIEEPVDAGNGDSGGGASGPLFLLLTLLLLPLRRFSRSR